jgi:hypothetical protein
MLDELSIQKTLNRYCEGASRGDWEQVLSTYAPQGVWEVPGLGLTFEGVEAIRGALVAFTKPMAYIVQINAPGVIEVDGDTASARSIIRECGKYADRDVGFEALGAYVDTLVRTADQWTFAKRVFRVLGKHEFPLLPTARPA